MTLLYVKAPDAQPIAEPAPPKVAYQGRPSFIPAEAFRLHMTAGSMDQWLIIGGIWAEAYIAREKKHGRPFKSIVLGSMKNRPEQLIRGYRPLDIVARARAQLLTIEPGWKRGGKVASTPKEAKPLPSLAPEVIQHLTQLTEASAALTGLYMLTEKQIVSAANRYKPCCGVYFLIKDNKVMYVGQSVDIHSRMRQHAKTRDFDSYTYIPCEPDSLDIYESLYIHALSPDWNAEHESGKKTAPISLLNLLNRALPKQSKAA